MVSPRRPQLSADALAEAFAPWPAPARARTPPGPAAAPAEQHNDDAVSVDWLGADGAAGAVYDDADDDAGLSGLSLSALAAL